jgi:hypothetical protein
MRGLRFQTYIIAALLVGIAGVYLYGGYQQRRLRDALQTELIGKNELEKETASLYSKYALEVKRVEKFAALSDSLKKRLERRGEELRQASSAVLRYKSLYAEIQGKVSIDTVTVPDSDECRIDFEKKIGRITVHGESFCPSGLVTLRLDQDPLKLDLYLTETRSGLFRSYLETNDSNLLVEELNVHYEPERPSFWQRHWLKLGMGAGVITYVLLK